MGDVDVATLAYRVQQVEDAMRTARTDVAELERRQAVQEEQIGGAGGLVKAMEHLGSKVDGLHRALYAFAASFVVAAVTIALTVGH